jgi:pSer/pThr/pTyr-binding forkhead associated (FHA) protein
MMNSLRRIEVFVESMLEKSAGRLPGNPLAPSRILAHLILSMEEHSLPDAAGRWIAPNSFRITLGARVRQSIRSLPDLERRLESKLQEHSRKYGLLLRGPISMEWDDSPHIPAHEIRIQANINDDEQAHTNPFRPEGAAGIPLPPGAFFIVDGNRHIPLDKPVVSIGRHLENQIALPDPLISRRHAQLRARNGQYLVTDLGSKHGTRVNDVPIGECLLSAGDVLRIGHTELIYGDEREDDRTEPLSFAPASTPQKNNA